MAEFKTVLGPAPQKGYASTGGTDELFPDASLQMQQNLDNGRAAFAITLGNADADEPNQVVVEAFEIKGFSADGCEGKIVCQNSVLTPPVTFEAPKQLGGGGWHMAPKTHDGGALSGLQARCGCDTAGVRSFRIIVHVEMRYDANPTLPANLAFEMCMECKRIEA